MKNLGKVIYSDILGAIAICLMGLYLILSFIWAVVQSLAEFARAVIFVIVGVFIFNYGLGDIFRIIVMGPEELLENVVSLVIMLSLTILISFVIGSIVMFFTHGIISIMSNGVEKLVCGCVNGFSGLVNESVANRIEGAKKSPVMNLIGIVSIISQYLAKLLYFGTTKIGVPITLLGIGLVVYAVTNLDVFFAAYERADTDIRTEAVGNIIVLIVWIILSLKSWKKSFPYMASKCNQFSSCFDTKGKKQTFSEQERVREGLNKAAQNTAGASSNNTGNQKANTNQNPNPNPAPKPLRTAETVKAQWMNALVIQISNALDMKQPGIEKAQKWLNDEHIGNMIQDRMKDLLYYHDLLVKQTASFVNNPNITFLQAKAIRRSCVGVEVAVLGFDKYINRELKRRQDEEAREKKTKTNIDRNVKELVYIKHCSNMEELSKQYKKLSSVYHPDNSTGDEEIMKQLNVEYQFWKSKLAVNS